VLPWTEICEPVDTGEKSLHSIMSFELVNVIASFSAKEYLETPNHYSMQISETVHIMLEETTAHRMHTIVDNVKEAGLM
jgi:hypothetical protein